MSTQENNRSQVPATLPTPPTDEQIAALRKRGAAAVAYRKEIAFLRDQIAGLEWGSGAQVVKGSSFSKGTQYALAHFCRITRANPMTQVDILGGRPYLNVHYWADRINADPSFVDYRQREISERTEQGLRDRAKQLREDHEALKSLDANRAAQALSRALDLEDEADDIARARAHYDPPDWASHVYETIIRKFMNAAPIQTIQAGEISRAEAEEWIVEVRECNWAGGRSSGKPDPVGNAEPEKTARTRSLRRTATRAFPAWANRYDEQVRKAEEVIDVEWEVLEEEREEDRQLGAGPQTVQTGSGEPEQSLEREAEELPDTEEPAPDVGERPPPAEPSENGSRENARRKYFATLRDAEIDDRKAWQAKWVPNFPGSTKEWSTAQFEKAVQLAMQPIVERYRQGCEHLGYDPEDYALQNIRRLPETLADYLEVLDLLNAEAYRALADREAR